jgi:DNA-binding Lrp family transcriptional regulator
LRKKLEIILKFGELTVLEAAEVLKEIYNEGVLNIARLARRLRVSPEAVRELVSSLRDRGYLEAVEFECSNSSQLCRRCPVRASCHKRSLEIKLYRLSEQGLRLIEEGKEA